MARQKYFGIGGQVIPEDIMTKDEGYYACVARREDGGTVMDRQRYVSLTNRYPLLRPSLARGIFSFADSMILGMQVLGWPAEIYAGGDESTTEEEPSKFEVLPEKTFDEKAMRVVMGVIMVLSFLIAIGIFMLLPMFLMRLLKRVIASETLIAVLESVLRILIFVCYIKAVSQIEDIHRTFMYHGAEHRRIGCVKHGLPLTVENVMRGSREYKYCGTSLILAVMMISILFFIVIRPETLLLRAVSRILLMPVIAGIPYELPCFTGAHDSAFVNVLNCSGMWMQGFVTRELTPNMAEVVMQAVEAVFDQEDYLQKNFDMMFLGDEASV